MVIDEGQKHLIPYIYSDASPGIPSFILRDSIPGSEVVIPGLEIPILGKFYSKLLNFFQ
jgi:hypothetical protein